MNVIGLDFGTNYCRAACLTPARPQAIPNALEELATPAWVRFTSEERVKIGREARPATYSPGEIPLTGIKNKLASSGTVWFGSAMRPPAEIAALLMQALREDAERALRGPVVGAVVTIPALAGTRQRTNTREAAKLAGFEEVKLINEPTAAALAHWKTKAANRRLLVYALGAGYFEVAIIENNNQTFKTLSVVGDGQVGGNAFDRKILNYLLESIKQKYDLDLSTDPQALWLLARAAEEAKIKLSVESLAKIVLPNLGSEPSSDAANLNLDLSRAELEDALSESIDLTVSLTHKVLAEAELTISDIDDLLLVGGSTRLPVVQQKLQATFNKEPILTTDDITALGAAWQATSLEDLAVPEDKDARSEQADAKTVPTPEKTFSSAMSSETTEIKLESTLPDLDRRYVTATPLPALEQAFSLLQQGKHQQAVALLQPLYKEDPTNEKVCQLLATIYHDKGVNLANTGHLTEAIQILETGLKYDRHNNKLLSHLVMLYEYYAWQLDQSERLEEAIPVFEKALTYEPDNKRIKENLVRACLENVRQLAQDYKLDEVIQKCEMAFIHDPNNILITRTLGWAYAHKGNQFVRSSKWEEAIQSFEKAAEHDPGDKRIKEILVKTCLDWNSQLEQEKRWDEAIQPLEKAFKYDLYNRNIKRKLMIAYEKSSVRFTEQGKWDEAIKDLQKALGYDPDDKKIENQMIKLCLTVTAKVAYKAVWLNFLIRPWWIRMADRLFRSTRSVVACRTLIMRKFQPNIIGPSNGCVRCVPARSNAIIFSGTRA